MLGVALLAFALQAGSVDVDQIGSVPTPPAQAAAAPSAEKSDEKPGSAAPAAAGTTAQPAPVPDAPRMPLLTPQAEQSAVVEAIMAGLAAAGAQGVTVLQPPGR